MIVCYFQVFNLFEGKVLQRKNDLHSRDISAILFFNPLKFLVTGAKDGTSACLSLDA